MIFSWFRDRRRRRLLAESFPPEWERWISGNVRLWDWLDDDDRDRLRAFVRVFVGEKYWEGCGGLEMTDEIRVTIAANAGFLVLGHEPFYFERLSTILVYPDRYVVKTERQIRGGIVTESNDVRLGEAWNRGPVVLAWKDVLEGGVNHDDGRNVVLHEFAHLLDMDGGDLADGVPYLDSEDERVTWSEVTELAYRQLVRQTRSGRRSLLSSYGATNPAEFFAVATECFFERPRLMEREMPDLYAVLCGYYRQRPGEWKPR